MRHSDPSVDPAPALTASLRSGALYALGAALSFALAGACVKAVAPQTSNTEVVFFRNLLALVILLPIWMRGRIRLRTENIGHHLLRAGFGTAAMYCFFHALGSLSLGEAIVLNYCTPLYIPLIAWLWLGEKPPWIILPAIALGLLGIALLAWPAVGSRIDAPFQGEPTDYLIAALAGPLAATAMVCIRRLSSTEPPARIVLWFALISTAISIVPLLGTPIHWASLPWAGLIGVGLFATIGQMLMTRAYALAPAARIGAVGFAIVMFASLLGWLVWDETPTTWTGAGSLLVLLCAALASWESRPQHRDSVEAAR